MSDVKLPTIEEVYTLINGVHNVNVMLQIQSYGRIYVYDQMDIVSKDNAVEVFRDNDNEESMDDFVKRAYYEYYKTLCVVKKNRDELHDRLENGTFEGAKLKKFQKATKMLAEHVRETEPFLSEYHVDLKVKTWMRGPNTHFMGETPNDQIEAGKGRKVISLLEQLLY